MLKKLAANILTFAFSTVVTVGGAEWGVRQFYSHKVRTYFDDQTVKTLGDPVPAKQANEYRIFIFGGSTAYGFPLADRYSIAAWLNKSFPYLLPDKKVRVINTAWPGKGSHYSLEGALDALKYKPDLFIVYDGYNEVSIANRLYLDNWVYWLNLRLKFRSASYRLLSKRLDKLRKHIIYGKSGFVEKHYRDEVIANQVYKTSEIDEAYYQRILARYQQNMETVIRYAKRHGVEVLFLTLPANVHDIPPVSSVHATSLTETEHVAWKVLFEGGLKLAEEKKHTEAVRVFEQAARMDPAHAELQYRLGLAYEAVGNYAAAKAALNLARDYDAMPWRARSSLNDLIRNLALRNQAMLLDLTKIFEVNSTHGIVDKDLIYDNVHPSEKAQLLIADEIAKLLSRSGKIAPSEEWRWEVLDQTRQGEARLAWQIDPSVESHHIILRGIHYWEQGHYEEVIPSLEKGLELKPDFVELYGFLGDAYWHLGNKEEAFRAFEAFEHKDPSALKDTLQRYPDIQQSYNQSRQAPQSTAGLR